MSILGAIRSSDKNYQDIRGPGGINVVSLQSIPEFDLRKLSETSLNINNLSLDHFDMADLQDAAFDLMQESSDLDGSSRITPFINALYQSLEEYSSQETINHHELFANTVKQLLVANVYFEQTEGLIEEVVNRKSGVSASLDQMHEDEFRASSYVLMHVACDIAAQNGVDIEAVLVEARNEFRTDLGIRQDVVNTQEPEQGIGAFELNDYIENHPKTNLRPESYKSRQIDSAKDEGIAFLEAFKNDLKDHASELQKNNRRLGYGDRDYWHSGDDIGDIFDITSNNMDKPNIFGYEGIFGFEFHDRPEFTINNAIYRLENRGFVEALGRNPAIQSAFLESVSTSEPDLDAVKLQWQGAIDYYQKYGALEGAERIHDLDPETIEHAINSDRLNPHLREYFTRAVDEFLSEGDVSDYDIDLKDAFQKTDPTGSEYWSLSSDSRVQFEQLQGTQGSRAPIAVSTPIDVTGLRDQQERQKNKDAAFLDLLSSMEEARRLFREASQAAQRALDVLGQSIDRFKVELDDLREEFDQNTVTLSDGTKVYYNTENSKFERQDERGDWHALEDEEAVEETFQKAEAQGGLVSTKQGKQALDERQESLDSGMLFILTQQDRLVEIDQAVEGETLSLEDATKQKEQITQETEERTQQLDVDGKYLEQTIAPIAIHEQSNSHAAYEKQSTEEWDNQAGSPELEALFEDSEETPANQSSSIITGPMR